VTLARADGRGRELPRADGRGRELPRADGRGRELPLRPDDELSLVDLLDRLLAGGVMLTGDITISLADVDLVHVSLRALISSVATLTQPDGEADDA
jgi:hypothetical protein